MELLFGFLIGNALGVLVTVGIFAYRIPTRLSGNLIVVEDPDTNASGIYAELFEDIEDIKEKETILMKISHK